MNIMLYKLKLDYYLFNGVKIRSVVIEGKMFCIIILLKDVFFFG